MALDRMSALDSQLVRQIHTMGVEDRASVTSVNFSLNKDNSPSLGPTPAPILERRPTLRRNASFWKAPKAASHGEGHEEPPRSETWLELFLDLVFVAAVTNLGEVSACALDAQGIFSTYLLFSALNHIWMSLTVYANRFEGLDVFHVLVFGMLSLAGCLFGLHLRSGDGVKSSVTELGIAKNCTRLPGTSLFDILEVSAYPTVAYTACLGLLAMLYLKIAINVQEEKKVWALESVSFVVEAALWGVSIGSDGWLRTVLWASGRGFKLLLSPGISYTHTSPYHVGHLHGRMCVFVLLYLGESIIQIVTAPIPAAEGGYYKTTAALCVGICFNFSITYLHTQPHHPHEHFIAKHPRLSWIWMSIHTEALLFTVFLTSVGIKLLFQGLLTPFACTGPEYLLICIGVGGSHFISNTVRFLHKGCRSKHQNRRMGSYIYRLFVATICILCPVILGPSEEYRAVVLLTPIFLLGLLTVCVDTFAGSNQEIAKELLDHGHSMVVNREHERHNSVTLNHEGARQSDTAKAERYNPPTFSNKAISFALLPDLFVSPAAINNNEAFARSSTGFIGGGGGVSRDGSRRNSVVGKNGDLKQFSVSQSKLLEGDEREIEDASTHVEIEKEKENNYVKRKISVAASTLPSLGENVELVSLPLPSASASALPPSSVALPVSQPAPLSPTSHSPLAHSYAETRNHVHPPNHANPALSPPTSPQHKTLHMSAEQLEHELASAYSPHKNERSSNEENIENHKHHELENNDNKQIERNVRFASPTSAASHTSIAASPSSPAPSAAAAATASSPLASVGSPQTTTTATLQKQDGQKQGLGPLPSLAKDYFFHNKTVSLASSPSVIDLLNQIRNEEISKNAQEREAGGGGETARGRRLHLSQHLQSFPHLHHHRHEAIDRLASLTQQLPFKKRVLNTLWRCPQPCQEWGEKTHFRHESWYELFFDLMFVGCCLALGGAIKCALSPIGLVTGYMIFSALSRTWIGFTTYINKFDSGHVFHLTMFGFVTLCVAIMGLYMAPRSGHECLGKENFEPWDILFHVEPMVVANAVAQILLGVLYVQVAYFYPSNRKHWLIVALSFFVNAIFWLASLTLGFMGMTLLWIAGHFLSHVVEWLSFLAPSNAPLHIPLMNTRMGMFVMLMLGESVIQIVIAGLPINQVGPYFELNTIIAFLTAFNFAVHYFHTQAKTPSHHILRRSVAGTWLFYRLHKNLAYFILLMGVGFKAMNSKLSAGLYPSDKYYWLLCSGAGVATFLTLGLRMLNQPRSTWQKIEKLNYVLVFLFAISIQALPAIMGPDKLGVFFLILPVFILSSVVAFSVFFLKDTSDQRLSFVETKEAVANMVTFFDVDDR